MTISGVIPNMKHLISECRRPRLCIAGGDNTEERDARLQTGLLAGIIMTVVIMAAAVLLSVYVYNHPTSSVSLFFMEVSDTQLWSPY